MQQARLGIVVLLLGTAACSAIYSPPNVYPMSQAEVVDKLARLDVEPSGTGPFGRLEFNASRQGSDTVIWTATGSHARRRCEIHVAPVDAASSRVDISCGGGSASAGAAAGLELGATRKSAIELIDATLEGRPYDFRLAQGSTAWSWPEDKVDHGSYADAVGTAVAMDRAARVDASRQGR
jgi:hypothetical protein